MYANRGWDVGIAGFLGICADICKLNYIIGLRRVQLYQPIDIPARYRKFVLSKKSSCRGNRSRYDFVTEKIMQNSNHGIHLDVGTNFGFIPLSLGRRGLLSIGFEVQYFSYQIATCLARLEGNDCALFVNCDVTEIVDRIPAVESISMLSVLHHIVAGFDDAAQSTAFLRSLFSRARRRLILEIADHSEGDYSWCEKNHALHGDQTALEWYSEFLSEQGFTVSGDIRYFDTHLGATRPILVADRAGNT